MCVLCVFIDLLRSPSLRRDGVYFLSLFLYVCLCVYVFVTFPRKEIAARASPAEQCVQCVQCVAYLISIGVWEIAANACIFFASCVQWFRSAPVLAISFLKDKCQKWGCRKVPPPGDAKARCVLCSSWAKVRPSRIMFRLGAAGKWHKNRSRSFIEVKLHLIQFSARL